MVNNSNEPGTATRRAGAAGLITVGAIGGAALVGGLIAGIGAANAATATPTPSSTSSSSGTTTEDTHPAHGSAAHETLEKPVTGANATKAQDAAVKSVGSGTAGAVTTDMTGDGYEVTVTKSDGSAVEVHLDSAFAVEDHGQGR